MKKIGRLILTAMVVIFLSPLLGQGEEKADNKALFVQVIQARMRVLERHYQVKFDPTWKVSERR